MKNVHLALSSATGVCRVCIIVTGAIVVSVATAIACYMSQSPYGQVIVWTDPTSGTKCTLIIERESPVGNVRSQLLVSIDGKEQSRLLDDDADFGTARFVRYNDWLLVINDDRVFGGFNLCTGRLVGEYEWGQLPFTMWGGSGTVVAEKKVSRFELPNNYGPDVPDPALQHKSSE